MTDSLSRRLVALSARPIDGPTRARAALHVLDWFGCALLGATAEAGRILVAHARVQPAGPCLAIGATGRAAAAAAFVNGGLGNIFEMDDLHRTSIVHPGPVAIPAALAAAQRDGAGGAAFLEAVVRGYEAAARIGSAVGPGHYRHWHNTSTCGGFGAAAAVASLLGLDLDRTVDAFGHAGTQASGLWQCRIEPTHSKQLHTAHAAQAGLVAADLAALGFAGAQQILEGSHGLFAATCPDPDPAAVVADPDGPWKIYETSFKPWPACRHTHPIIEAALKLREGLPLDSVTAIHVKTYEDAITFCDNQKPRTSHDARFSLQHCAAAALVAGAPGLADFEPAAIADPLTAALRARVDVTEGDAYSRAFPERYGAELRVSLADGSTRHVAVEAAKGDPENPMSPAEIEAKARGLMAAAGLAGDRIERLVAGCLALPEGGPLSALSDVLSESLTAAAQ